MLAAILLFLAAVAERPLVEWKEGEIWLTREGATPAQLTHDGCEKDRQPAWSPDGTMFAYYTVRTVDRPQCPAEVVLFSAGGARLKSIPVLDRGNAITRIDWLGNYRIGVDTHINPSLGQYRVVDLTTGKIPLSYAGHTFRPSPDSRHIAHAGWVPHFSPPFAKCDYLMVDDRIVYPPDPGKEPNFRPPDSVDKLLYRDISEFRTDFAWSQDGTRIAFIENLSDWRADQVGSYEGKAGNVRWYLVVVPASGGAPLRRQLPPVSGGVVTVEWAGSGRVRIAGGGVDGEYPVNR